MRRSAYVLVGVLALGLVSWVSVGRTDSPDQDVKAEAKIENREAATNAAELVRKLATPITLDDRIDGPLGDAIQHLEQRYGVTIIMDQTAFSNDVGDPDVPSKKVQLDKLKKVRLGTVLQKLAAQVQGGYLVKPDHIAIVPQSRLETLVWGTMEPGDGPPRVQTPLVHAVFDKRPLSEALKELVDATGVSVILDSRRAGDQAKAEVTATLLNAPLDTAVRILANQAELDTVILDNVLYVTTADNAVTLRPSQRQMVPFGLGAVEALGGGRGQ